jgi:uncharacterized membrane protein HdeD (DUF308 family)
VDSGEERVMHGVVIDTSGRPVGVQRMWPMLVVHGGLIGVLGLATLVWPALTATTFVVLLGAFLIVDGIASLLFGVRRRKQRQGGGGWTFHGVVALGFGLVAVIWPQAVAFLALVVMGLWLLLISLITVGVGSALRRSGSRVWGWPTAFGVIGIVLSLVMIFNPAGSLLAVTAVLGVLLLAGGIALVAAGLRMRRFQLTGQ